MDTHILKTQVNRLVADGVLKETDREAALASLKTYWLDRIAIVWSVVEVRDCAESKGMDPPSRSTCREILQEVLEGHDANYGISWNEIENALYERKMAG